MALPGASGSEPKAALRPPLAVMIHLAHFIRVGQLQRGAFLRELISLGNSSFSARFRLRRVMSYELLRNVMNCFAALIMEAIISSLSPQAKS